MNQVKIFKIIRSAMQLEGISFINDRVGLNCQPATGWQISKMSGVSLATTYRYLPQLVKLGLLKPHAEGRRNGLVVSYLATKAGKDYVSSWLAIPF